MIQVYAVTTAPAPVGGLAGVDGVGVELVACGRLYAVTSRHERCPSSKPAQALEHAHVVESVACTVPALPVRFGSWHPDEASLRIQISKCEDSLITRVRQIAYRVEFVVRTAERPVQQRTDSYPDYPGLGNMHVPAQAGIDGRAGSAYLNGRLARERAALALREAARSSLNARTAGLADLAVGVSAREGERGFEIAYLVEAEKAAHFRRLADAAVARDRSLLVGGPWPPYTFAAESSHAT